MSEGGLGLDALSEVRFRSAISRAIDSSHAHESQSIRLGRRAHTYNLFKATYSGKTVPAEVTERRRNVNGLLALQISAEGTLGGLPSIDGLEVDLQMVPPLAGGTAIELLSDRDQNPPGQGRPTITWLETNTVLEFPGRQFAFSIRKPVYWRSIANPTMILAGVSGMVLTLLLVMLAKSSRFGANGLPPKSQKAQPFADPQTRKAKRERAMPQSEAEERKRAEGESSLLGRILDKSSNEIYVFDAATLRFTQVNQGAQHNLGYSMQELQNLTPLDLKPEFSKEEFFKLIEPLYTGEKKGLAFQTVHRRKDGSTYPVEVRLQLSEAGQSPQFVALIQDVTERQRAEQALRESEARFRTLTEHAPEAVVLLDCDTGKFVEVNSNAVQLFGLSRDELLNCGPVELSAPIQAGGRASDQVAKKYIQQTLQGGTAVFEWIHRNAAGEDVPCEVRLVRLPAADRHLIRGSITDISERKQALEQMKKLSRALENTGDAVVITNRKGVIEYVNPAFEEITGFSKEEAIGKNPNIIKSGKHDKAFYKKLWGTVLSGENYRDIFINRKKDGSLYYEEKAITPLKDEEGRINSFVSLQEKTLANACARKSAYIT